MFTRILNKFKKNNDYTPDVFVILLDQFRTDALSSHPIFEKIKDQGVFFSNTITYAPYTLASCHATFSGVYGKRNGVDGYTKSNQFKKDAITTIPQYLKTIDYYTSAYSFSSILIPHQGFDRCQFVSEHEEKNILLSHKAEVDHCYSQSKPFFCYLHYGEIHHSVLKEVIRKYKIDDPNYFGHIETNKNRYAQYAKNAGEYLAAMLDYIKKYNKGREYLVLVLTDHGGSNGEKVGEKAYGTFTYDYSIKIWQYWLNSSKLPKGLEIDTQVRTIDILPTFLDLLQIRPNKKTLEPDGESMLPIILNKDVAHRMAFAETGGVDGAFPSPDLANIHCVRDGEWKLIKNSTTNKFELYNLKNDPDELNNLYTVNKEKSQELLKELVKYL